MIETTLVAGAPRAREQAIAAALDPALPSAVILEGIPGPEAVLQADDRLDLARIAAGCPCCEGNLVLRVTLNRMLRRRPRRLFIGLAQEKHLAALRALLSTPPYAAMLQLTPDLHAVSS